MFSFFIWNVSFIWRERKKRRLFMSAILYALVLASFRQQFVLIFLSLVLLSGLNILHVQHKETRNDKKKIWEKKAKKLCHWVGKTLTIFYLYSVNQKKKPYQVGRCHCVFISGWKYRLNQMERQGMKIEW